MAEHMAENKTTTSHIDGQSYFLLLFITLVGSHLLFPIKTILYAPYTYFGILFIVFGIAIAFWSRSLFLRSKTTLSPYESPTSLVTSGPFRISRNPMYLGMLSVLLGSAILAGTLVPFAFAILFVIIIETRLIPGEEQRLEKIFGESYLDYKKKVRQWL